jgi:hypothetical protein
MFRDNLLFRAAAFALVFQSVPVCAASDLISQPLQLGDENVRYNHGQATVDVYAEGGSIQVRPALMDHGSLSFSAAVFNSGSAPANVDVSNFTLVVDGKTYKALSVETLQKKAKSRAAWATFAVALAGGLSAYAAASQRDTYTSTLYTPRGVYQAYSSGPSAIGQVEAAAIVAGTGVGIAAIQNKLDGTLDKLGNQIVQLSTVDPGTSYGGVIVFEKVPFKKVPARAEMVVDWNGHQYHLNFQVAKPGTPAPPFKPAQNFAQPVDKAPAASTDKEPAPEKPQAEPQGQTVKPEAQPESTIKT